MLKYRSLRTGLTVTLGAADSPIVNAYACLATEAFDDDGLPHTLEHLIFLGSEDYPYKEVLDLMANRCLADRTNAWTDTDHTCYTVYTAGSAGFLNILPVYMDHILHPLLRWAVVTFGFVVAVTASAFAVVIVVVLVLVLAVVFYADATVAATVVYANVTAAAAAAAAVVVVIIAVAVAVVIVASSSFDVLSCHTSLEDVFFKTFFLVYLSREEDYMTEVHHVSGEGEDAGVVYSEMQVRPCSHR